MSAFIQKTVWQESPQVSCTKSHFCFLTAVILHTLYFLFWKKQWQKAKAISLHLMILQFSFISHLCCFPTKLTNPCLILIFSKLLSGFPSCALIFSMPRLKVLLDSIKFGHNFRFLNNVGVFSPAITITTLTSLHPFLSPSNRWWALALCSQHNLIHATCRTNNSFSCAF